MNIAIDWDRTMTRDMDMWRSFVELAKSRGHCVMIVTQRYQHECIDAPDGIGVIYCDRQAKAKVLNRQGIRIDIWIDDNPLSMIQGA